MQCSFAQLSMYCLPINKSIEMNTTFIQFEIHYLFPSTIWNETMYSCLIIVISTLHICPLNTNAMPSSKLESVVSFLLSIYHIHSVGPPNHHWKWFVVSSLNMPRLLRLRLIGIWFQHFNYLLGSSDQSFHSNQSIWNYDQCECCSSRVQYLS